MPEGSTDRWAPRPVATFCVRTVVAAIPVAASVAAGVGVSRALPDSASVAGQVGRVALVLASSVGVFSLVGRGARRLIPLAMLLRLSLVFPDRAPSRFGMALRASSPRRLRELAGAETCAAGSPGAAKQAETVLTLIVALGAHDRRTRGHSERVQALTDLVAVSVGLSSDDTDRLRWAALLHDIGKLRVSSRVLNLPGRPNAAELRMLRGHPAEGARLAEPLASWLGEWRHGIDQHHERYDGTGYPAALSGTEISLAGRIVAVTDAFETMTSVRSYKKAMSVREARTELVDSAGSHFDPKIVRSFLDISLGKLRWRLGAAAALAELPLIGFFPRAATVAGASLTAAGPALGLGSAALFGLGVLTLPGAPVVAHPATPTRSPTVTVATTAARPTVPPPNTGSGGGATMPGGAVATITPGVGGTAQGLVQSVRGAVGSPLPGVRIPLALPGTPIGAPLPLP
jgi:HD-GYP domain-containing protein (c-di-GMP phosphodiesterase class II)